MKLLLSIAFLLSFSPLALANEEEREFAKLRSADDLSDAFEPSLQNLCKSDKTFKLGDDCDVSFAWEDMETTDTQHIFESKACGSEEFIMVTMDPNTHMPQSAVRMSRVSIAWMELVFMPKIEEFGCMYTTVKMTDVDHKKMKKYSLEGDSNTHGRRAKA